MTKDFKSLFFLRMVLMGIKHQQTSGKNINFLGAKCEFHRVLDWVLAADFVIFKKFQPKAGVRDVLSYVFFSSLPTVLSTTMTN